MDSQTTIGNLFNGRIQFTVPNYQRAYSWRVRENGSSDCQVNQFLDDLMDQQSDKKYYLGHFLFETLEDGKKYAVIDGQQRLTTIVIFMGSLVSLCRKRGILELGGYPVDLISDTYLEYHGQKFTTVPKDSLYFMNRVLKGKPETQRVTDRKSEICIQQSADFFDTQLSKVSADDLVHLFKTVDSAQITTYTLAGDDAKLTATQIFALQNDRGKKLTELEKLKAFLMHQIYRFSDENCSSDIDSIDEYFSDIFSSTEVLKNISEDTVLRWHTEAYLPHWTDPFDNVKSCILECPDKDKRNWILDFSASLMVTFRKVIEIETAKNGYSSYIADICCLDKSNSTMPLLIKLAHDDKLSFNGYSDEVLKYIERILFKLTFTTGDYRTNSFIFVAKQYSSNSFDELLLLLKKFSENGFKDYWEFTENCRRYFEGDYHYTSELRYVLYKYENYLRDMQKDSPHLPIDECSNVFKPVSLQNTLDHITPVNPDFTEYSEDFKTRFLYNIGNLSLLIWSKNSSKSNNDPVQVKEKYNGVYLAQKDIYNTLCTTSQWGKKEIADRRMKILRFVFQTWEIGNPDNIKELV